MMVLVTVRYFKYHQKTRHMIVKFARTLFDPICTSVRRRHNDNDDNYLLKSLVSCIYFFDVTTAHNEKREKLIIYKCVIKSYLHKFGSNNVKESDCLLP